MRRVFLVTLTACVLSSSGCASLTKAIIRSMLGLDDEEELDPTERQMNHLYDAGYGFNNPKAEENRKKRLRERGYDID